MPHVVFYVPENILALGYMVDDIALMVTPKVCPSLDEAKKYANKCYKDEIKQKKDFDDFQSFEIKLVEYTLRDGLEWEDHGDRFIAVSHTNLDLESEGVWVIIK